MPPSAFSFAERWPAVQLLIILVPALFQICPNVSDD